jgi:hypothetical protein
MRNALILVALLLGGCATNGYPGKLGCDVKYVQEFVGRKGDQKLADVAFRKARADTIRWIWPGMAVTMDFRANRLNIELDAAGNVSKFTCG